MEHCEVLIVGGGPAGSACAWMLRHAGLDVMVVDRASFPRDKVCAGWITPQVLAALDLDPDEYRRGGRVIQPITGFRVGTIGEGDARLIDYGRVVSYGIRRCEFDHYLLQRASARTGLATPVVTIRRAGARWIVNEHVAASVVVGAGGHFCPVARLLNRVRDRDERSVVAAQEMEFAVPARGESAFTTDPRQPELYFCRDLKGYGWCFRKDRYVNVGLGRLDPRSLPTASEEFFAFLRARGVVPSSIPGRWRGHAYRIRHDGRRLVDDAILLAGDAAGLAYAESGEGIRPAVESGLMAAETLIEARGHYTRERLQPYAARLAARFGDGESGLLAHALPPALGAWVARALLKRPGFVRRVVLDRWFLRSTDPPLRLTTGLHATNAA